MGSHIQTNMQSPGGATQRRGPERGLYLRPSAGFASSPLHPAPLQFFLSRLVPRLRRLLIPLQRFRLVLPQTPLPHLHFRFPAKPPLRLFLPLGGWRRIPGRIRQIEAGRPPPLCPRPPPWAGAANPRDHLLRLRGHRASPSRRHRPPAKPNQDRAPEPPMTDFCFELLWLRSSVVCRPIVP